MRALIPNINCFMKQKTAIAMAAVATLLPAAFAHAEEMPITEVPASAHTTLYCRNSIGIQMNLWAQLENFEYYGYAQYLEEDGDDVYLLNPIADFQMDTYIKGKKTATGLSFPMPQPIYYYDQNGTQQMFYVDVFYYNPDQGDYFHDPEEVHSYDLELQPNGSYKFDYLGLHQEGSLWFTERMLGVSEGKKGDWMAYGELTCRLIPFDSAQPELPAGLTSKKYQFIDGDCGWYVNVGIDGNDCYIQGMLEQDPDRWVKGSFVNNVVSIPSGTYLGITDGLTIFATGAEDQGVQLGIAGDFQMTYDPETDTFTSDNILWEHASPELDEEYMAFEQVVIKPLPGKLWPSIQAPKFRQWFNYDSALDFGYIQFYLSSLNNDYDVLDPSRIEYAAFVDGELYELDPADYDRLDERMTWIPYNFTDNWDIFMYPRGLRSFYFYTNIEENLAIQERYLDEKGEYHYSAKLVVDVDGNVSYDSSKVDAVNSESRVISEEYYDLNGRRLVSPGQGVTLRKMTLSNGEVVVKKSIK